MKNKTKLSRVIAWVVTFALSLSLAPVVPLSVQAESSGTTIDMSDTAHTSAVTVTPPDTITYGDTLGDPTAEAMAGNVGTFTYYYTGTLAGGDSTAYDSADKPTLPGSYTVTATLVSDTHQGSGTATFTITPLRLTWDKSGTVYDKTYDGNGNATVATLPTLSGIINNDNVTVTLGTIAFDTFSVGTLGVSSRNSGIGGSDAWKYYPPWLQPTFEDATITPSYFTPVKDTHYTVSELNSEGWANVGFVITASNTDLGGIGRYQISKDGTDWSASITFSDDTDNGIAEFYLRHLTNFNLSAMATETYKLDTTPPTAEVKYRTNGFTAFLNTVTFGLFFKDTVEVEIQGADNLSGVAEIKYIKSATAITNFDSATWETGTGFSVSAREKFFLYVRVTDNVGNVSEVFYDSVVVFNESEPTASGEYTYASGDSLTIENIVMNGNTVKSISGNGITSDDYTSEPGKITFTSAFMATLDYGTDHAPEDYTFIVEWNPMGETWIDGEYNDIPGTTIITITVKSLCINDNHDYDNYTSNGDATCEIDGTETATCTRCGDTGGNTRTEVNSALGHAGGSWIPNEGTCGQPGTEREICTRCNTELDTRTVDSLGHNFIDNWTTTLAPTCIADGERSRSCTRNCGETGHTQTEPITNRPEHNYTEFINTTATCEAAGNDTFECSTVGCNATTTVARTALGHDFQNYTSNNNATCTANGTETAVCERCTVTDTRTVANSMLPHNFGTWTVTTPATATTTGLETRICTVCNTSENRTIPATGGGGGNGESGRGDNGNGGRSANSGSSSTGTVAGNDTQPSGHFQDQIDTFVRGSGEALTLTIDIDFADFREVRRNGFRLTADTHYTAKSGSTIITLLPEYLDKLEAGEHNLSVHFKGNVVVNLAFTVAEYEDVSSAAGIVGNVDNIGFGAEQTSVIQILVAVGIVSGAGVGVVKVRRKRKVYRVK